jgi:hypothetical protein
MVLWVVNTHVDSARWLTKKALGTSCPVQLAGKDYIRSVERGKNLSGIYKPPITPSFVFSVQSVTTPHIQCTSNLNGDPSASGWYP